MKFEFATAGRVVFGPGTYSQAPDIAAQLAERYLLVATKSVLEGGDAASRLVQWLGERGIKVDTLAVNGEPDTESVDAGVRIAADAGSDGLIGLGGGSAIDTAKAIGALLTNGGSALDYMEVVGQGLSIDKPSAPVIAIPTTAGTGAEVTRNAVVAHRASGVKASLRSPFMLPRVAVIDPTLTHSVPAEVTATTGMDALTQLIEPLVSKRAQPMTDALAKEAIPRVARWLAVACAEPTNAEARENMSLASLFGGLALANSGLGAVHGFAAAIGGSHSIPHGAICAALLPHVMAANVLALSKRDAESGFLERYEQVARLLIGRSAGDRKSTIDAGIDFVRDLCRQVGIRPLSAYGITDDDVPAIVARTRAASSTKANPIELTTEELAETLRAAL